MTMRLTYTTTLLIGSLTVALSIAGQTPFSLDNPLIKSILQPSIAQAQSTLQRQESEIQLLSIEDFASLNLSAQLEAFIPEGLGQSQHPQDTRGTIGSDDRIEMLSLLYPWSAIGRIVSETANGSTGICSGTLIAADIVLTNAHCVMTTENGQLHRRIQFQPNVVNNAVRDLADVANVEAVFFTTRFEVVHYPPDPDDWAFLKLDQPLGDRYGTIPWMPLPIERLIEDYEAQVVMVGYSADYPRERPATSAGVHLGCSILGIYEGSIVHDCDTFGGSSGGPILLWIEEQPYIVGVNSAEQVNPEIVIDTFIGSDGSERSIYEGIVNFGVDISRIVQFIQQTTSDSQ